jgi:hypothetical protein
MERAAGEVWCEPERLNLGNGIFVASVTEGIKGTEWEDHW